jgi:hypothetical protein
MNEASILQSTIAANACEKCMMVEIAQMEQSGNKLEKK